MVTRRKHSCRTPFWRQAQCSRRSRRCGIGLQQPEEPPSRRLLPPSTPSWGRTCPSLSATTPGHAVLYYGMPLHTQHDRVRIAPQCEVLASTPENPRDSPVQMSCPSGYSGPSLLHPCASMACLPAHRLHVVLPYGQQGLMPRTHSEVSGSPAGQHCSCPAGRVYEALAGHPGESASLQGVQQHVLSPRRY